MVGKIARLHCPLKIAFSNFQSNIHFDTINFLVKWGSIERRSRDKAKIHLEGNVYMNDLTQLHDKDL